MGEDYVDKSKTENTEDRTLVDRTDILGDCLPFLTHIEMEEVPLFLKCLASFKNDIIITPNPKDQPVAARRFRALCRIGINIYNSRNQWSSVQKVAEYYDKWSQLVDEAIISSETGGFNLATYVIVDEAIMSSKTGDFDLATYYAIADEDFDLFLATLQDIEDMKSLAKELYLPAALLAQKQEKKKVKFSGKPIQRYNATIGQRVNVRPFPEKKKKLKTAATFGDISTEQLCKEEGVKTEDNLCELRENLHKLK